MKTRFFFLLLFFLGITVESIAYPISPRPLRKLIIESENIVYAYVREIKENNENSWNDGIAVLTIYEVLQGDLAINEIEVEFSRGMICPAPARYIEGDTVLAFVDQEEGRFYTHALSYGSKSVSAKEYKIFRQRIKEMQEILSMEDGENKNRSTIDWLIKCMIKDCTRWDGIYELSPESDFMSYYDQELGDFVLKYELSEEHKIKMREIFLNIEELGYRDLGLFDLISEKYDEEVIDHLKKSFSVSEDMYPYLVLEFTQRIAYATGDTNLINLYEEMIKLNYYDESDKEKRDRLIVEFKAAL